jgi:hypothetical protein
MYLRTHQKLMVRNFLLDRTEEIQIIILSITFGVIMFFPNIVLGQLTEQQLQVDRLEAEIESLKQQIKSSSFDPLGILFTQAFITSTGIAVAGATAFFAWQRERRTPLPAEQEKIFNEQVKEWYYHSFLAAYKRIWKELQGASEDKTKVHDNCEVLYRTVLYSKEFPKEEFHDIFIVDKKCQIRYLIKSLKLKSEDKEIDRRMQTIENTAEAEYHKMVREILPSIVEIAVDSALGSRIYDQTDEDHHALVLDSKKRLERLMIFGMISEDEEVIKILIDAIVRRKTNPNVSTTPKKEDAKTKRY